MPLSRLVPFLLAALAALLGLTLAFWFDWGLAVIIAANAFFVVYLALSFSRIADLNQKFLRHHAAASDVPVLVIFLATVGTVCAAMTSLFMVINADGAPVWRLLLALLAVPLAWATVHLMAAIHYAHLFWQPEAGEGQPRMGLAFPGTKEPAGWDFVYFAFVIGMAAQTSDVAITENHIRRFTIIHSVVAFFFNTVLVAAAVNLAVSLNG